MNCGSGEKKSVVEPDTSSDTTSPTDTVTSTDTAGPQDQTSVSDTVETGWTLAKIQDIPEGKSCHEAAEPEWFINHLYGIQLDGVVVASAKFDAYTNDEEPEKSLDGYFIADAAGGPMSGAVLVVPRQLESDYQMGDVLDIEGNVEDFNCMTRVTGDSVEKVGSGADVAPLDVTVGDLTDPATAESYEGVLVRLTDVTADEELQYGKFKLVGGLVVDDLLMPFNLELPLQQNIESLTGFINYAYGAYELVPRSESDISGPPANPKTTVTIQDVQKHVDGLNCETVEGGLSANIHNIQENLVIEGAVVVSPRFSTSDSLHMYYVSESTASPYAGIMLTVPAAWSSDYQIGDTLDITGEHVEFFCNSQISAEEVTVQSAGPAVEPLAIAAEDLTDPSIAESYEGVLVRVSGQTVSEEDQYGAYILSSGAVVDATVWDGLTMEVGGSYATITGVVTFSYYKYRILPRFAEDLVTGQ